LTNGLLLVLAVAWGTVLFFWVRSRSQGGFGDSVGLFHRHLHVLERTAPSTLAAANRLRAPVAAPTLARRGGVGPSSRPAVGRPSAPTGYGARSSGVQVVANARRRRSQRRRRDVLYILGILAVATAVVAGTTGMRTAVYAQVAVDVVLAAYIALLVRMRNLAAERDLKLRAIPTRPVAQRRAAAGPRRSQAQGGGYVVGGYGDLALRRAASN
jgi:hypothetical protein